MLVSNSIPFTLFNLSRHQYFLGNPKKPQSPCHTRVVTQAGVPMEDKTHGYDFDYEFDYEDDSEYLISNIEESIL